MAITSFVLLVVFFLITLLTMKSEGIYLRKQARKRAKSSLTSLTIISRQTYYSNQFTELSSYLKRVKNDDPDLIRAEVYNRHGKLENYLNPSLILPTDKTIVLQRTFFVNKMKFGHVLIEYRVTHLEAALNRIGSLLITGLLTALLLVGLTIHLTVKYIISIPLDKFIQASDEIGEGNLNRETGLKNRNDEIGYLAERFERMVLALKESMEEVEQNNTLLEARVKQRTAELAREKKLSSLGVLAAGVAHELNNPLSNISTYAQLMNEKIRKGKIPADSWVTTIINEANRGSSIVMQLLEFSRKNPPQKEIISLSEVIKEGIRLVSANLKKENILFKEAIIDKKCLTSANRHQLQQVVINLLNNAIHACTEGKCTKHSHTETDETEYPEKQCEITLSLNDSLKTEFAWEITISDNGSGMDEDTQEQIFNPFFTTKDVGKGTGLGLSVTYGIIQEHEGHITFTSTLDKGTTFKVFLLAANESTIDNDE